jgi:hypothetical protein
VLAVHIQNLYLLTGIEWKLLAGKEKMEVSFKEE